MSKNDKSVSRRLLLTGTITALAGVAATAYSRAQSHELDSHPDAQLLALGSGWKKAAAQFDASLDLVEKAEESFEAIKPSIPATLYAHPKDSEIISFLSKPQHRRRRYTGSDIKKMRNITRKEQRRDKVKIVEGIFNLTAEPGYIFSSQARARMDEIITAYDQWQSDLNRAKYKSGLTYALAQKNIAQKCEQAFCDRIASLPAQTLEGLCLKARISVWKWGGLDILQTELDMVKIDNESMAWAIVRDLAALPINETRC